MAIGDGASAEGWLVVPDTGEDGKVRYGAREINRTRDYAAAVKKLIPATNTEARTRAGISYGTAAPGSSTPGEVYFRII